MTRHEQPAHFKEAVQIMNHLLGDGPFSFSGELDDDEYVFDRGGMKIPLPAMSDGYRAYLGWIGDLLYHVQRTCPENLKLRDNHGIAMVDKIDLHLHPKWQMEVLPKLAAQLPNIQFIATTHSPLVVGSLEWMNIVAMTGSGSSVCPRRIEEGIHGLDADQVLLTELFGLKTTRAKGRDRKLKDLSDRASGGDKEAALELLKQMSHGLEDI